MIPQILEAPRYLQCVSHVSPGTRNHTYEEQWDVGVIHDDIEIDKVFVGSNFSAASVCLSESQMKLFLTPGSHSIDKTLLLFLGSHRTLAALEASDWQERSDGRSYSPCKSHAIH